MDSFDSRIAIGFIDRVVGLRGELGLRLFRPRHEVCERSPKPAGNVWLQIRSRETATKIIRGRWISPERLAISIENVTTREEAERFLKHELWVDCFAPPKGLCDDVDRLVHAEVLTASGNSVGFVQSVADNGAQAVLVVEVDGDEVLIPWVEALIQVKRCEPGEPAVLQAGDVPGLLEPSNRKPKSAS